jgi:hypothetical protein
MTGCSFSTYCLVAALLTGSCSGQETGTPMFGTTVVIPAGLRGEVYHIPKGSWVLPDFENIEPMGTIWTSSLNIPPRRWNAGFPGVTKRFEWFAIDYRGRFWIEKPGAYRFSLLSDDGSRLYIDDELVINNDCQHPPIDRDGSIALNGGIHNIRVSYFQGPRDCLALRLSVAGPEGELRVFSTDEFKPPSNTDDWKYGGQGELSRSPNPDAARPKLEDAVKKKPRKERQTGTNANARDAWSCHIPDPVPQCHG